MTEIDINIYSLNCNGLNDDVKRNVVFEKLKKRGEGIALLQETHCMTENEPKMISHITDKKTRDHLHTW